MEYKVVVAGYSTELKNLKAGWFEELTNLTNQLNEEAKEGWRVKEIIPTPTGLGMIYTVLLEKEKSNKST